jgi:predicted secreted protein
MANERRLGRYFAFKWKTNTVGGIKSMTLNIDGNNIDVSDADAGRWTKLVSGRKNISMDITCNYIQDNAPQGTMATDMLSNNTSGGFTFGPSATAVTGDVTFGGTGLISNVNISASDDDVTEISFTLDVDGELTRTVT